jgi:hydroxyacylglutathione hydrolase
MLLRTFEDRTLAQMSYMVGCQATGEALVIDPARDITPYLATAESEGLRITHITETHIHADYTSGARELAAATGALLLLSGEGGADWSYNITPNLSPNGEGLGVRLLHDGDTFRVGNVILDVLHTPGHTPEHLVFMLTDSAGANAPLGLFTGDCLFVGDMGRPDLLETAAGQSGTKEIGARGQFRAMQRLRAMPDYLQVFPGHGAGSACGKALGAVPSTTLGYEKRFNPAFQFEDERAFVDWLLADQPETPPYFGQMKRINRDGVTLLGDLPTPAALDPARLPALIAEGAQVFDVRPLAAFAAGYVAGTISVPLSSKLNSYVGYLLDYTRPYYLIAEAAQMPELRPMLYAVGADQIGGYFEPSALVWTATLAILPAPEVQTRIAGDGAYLLDVRGGSEYSARHIAEAHHLPLPFLARQLQTIPREQPIIVQCASGHRSQIAASYMRAHGFRDVSSLAGGITGWMMAKLPVVEG